MKVRKRSDWWPLFWRITWRLELFTHAVPVPVSLYFTLVAAPASEETRFTGMVIGSASGVVMVLTGLVWRGLRLRRLFHKADRAGDPYLKDRLLSHPMHEALVIAARWLIGLPAGHIVFIQLLGYQEELHRSLPAALAMTVPLSMAVYFLITESVIRRELGSARLRETALPAGRPIRRVGSFHRVWFTIVAVAMIPIALMGYLLHQVVNGNMNLEHPGQHILAMVVLFMVPATVAAVVLAQSIRSGLAGANETLSVLGVGDLDVKAAVVTADEFGEHAEHLDSVIGHLRALVGRIRSINAGLEERVGERTRQLEQTLAEVQELKTQQDGDYYLTSLLLGPLSSGMARTEAVEVQAIVEQKKRFAFRHRQGEIGGDLCAAHPIRLRGRSYMAFVNADAMGKSVQGAGGAVVLGTVFKSVIARTRLVEVHGRKRPEQWLRDCYMELQAVFESFDGLMLASAVVGILDEETGVLYFFNADHPPAVRYRKGSASFLPSRGNLPKLGVYGLGAVFQVELAVLEPGDVLVLGSDGRDDIDLSGGGTSAGATVRNLNQDPKLFLELVRTHAGQLRPLMLALRETGDLIDDCSLMRLAIAPQMRFSLGGSRTVGEISDLAHEYASRREWAEAGQCYAALADLCPHDSELLYRTAYCLKLAKRLKEAVEFGECCRLREPAHVHNLVNLGDIYRLLGRTRRAGDLHQMAHRLDAPNPHVQTLGRKLAEE